MGATQRPEQPPEVDHDARINAELAATGQAGDSIRAQAAEAERRDHPADAVPVPEAPVAQAERNAETVAAESVQAALAAIDQANPSVVRDEPADDVDPDPPVYDERGNVRPRGTPGARPMTKAERTKIAQALARGEAIVTTAEKRPSK